ncbi:hypothetical protein [Saccharothrix sp. NRRL B-16348]|uniref:hypothetical protein n=1 Tax=Saccharothrix sp. NRRL B-16348 TaxID=1415542 RepID=UPI0006AF7E45|nr:hypothetical protein [Saccharothrix sp. NRRL B-16348]
MTVRADGRPRSEVLEAVLGDLRDTCDRADPLGESIVVAVESLLRLVAVADRPVDRRADAASLEDVREALHLMRAGVVTTSYLLWSVDERLRRAAQDQVRRRTDRPIEEVDCVAASRSPEHGAAGAAQPGGLPA